MPSNLLLIGFKKAGDVGAGPLQKLYSAVLGCAITMDGLDKYAMIFFVSH